MAQAQAGDLESQARDVGESKVLSVRVDGLDRQQMRTLVDSLRNKWKSAVVVLAAVDGSDISIVSGVTKDLTSKVQAGKLVQEIALGTGGKGGGRPDMAEGGGKNVSALAAELGRVYETVKGKL
jgi:alanyl-tRNA synthetase